MRFTLNFNGIAQESKHVMITKKSLHQNAEFLEQKTIITDDFIVNFETVKYIIQRRIHYPAEHLSFLRK